MILGIDTSAGQCAVALVAGDSIVAGAVEPMARGHAERLFPLIETALAEAGLGVESIQRIAVCTGPGSFTGLRVGVAAARGLALGRGIPAIGVTRFEAVAAEAVRPDWARCTRASAIGAGAGASAAAFSMPGALPGAPFAGSVPRAVEDRIGWAEARPVAVALAGRGTAFLQRFGPDMRPLGEPALVTPEALAAGDPADVRLGDGWAMAGLEAALLPEGLADPAIVAAMGGQRRAGPLPAPLYLREADADLPAEAPPRLLD